MKALRTLLIGSAFAVALTATPARAQEANPWKFEFHGFVSVSLFAADSQFGLGPGQNSLWTATEGTVDKLQLGGDIRQSRMSLSMAGPMVFGEWQPKGVLEFDLFGGMGAGVLGDESVLPRIRVVYAELKSGKTTIQIGQMNQLIVTQIPTSLSHIAFPWSYAAGTLGWRSPGVQVYRSLPMSGVNLELAGAVQRGVWADSNTVGAGASNSVSLGEAGFPQVEGRLKLDGKVGDATWTAYVAGHWDRKDLSGWSAQAVPGADDTLDGYAAQLGGKFTLSPITFAFNAYTGKAIGNLLGQAVQFGDVESVAGWAQLGFFATKELSIWAGFGLDKPKDEDVDQNLTGQARRKQNQAIVGMLRYASGNYSLAAEYFRTTTKYGLYAAAGDTTPAAEQDQTGQQVIVTAMYAF